jgi:hypothetical protein
MAGGQPAALGDLGLPRVQGLAEFLRVYSLNHIVGVVLTLLTINPTTLPANH